MATDWKKQSPGQTTAKEGKRETPQRVEAKEENEKTDLEGKRT